jgi:hypothetical protein
MDGKDKKKAQGEKEKQAQNFKSFQLYSVNSVGTRKVRLVD